MATERDSLLREVDEELRRDQFQQIWEQYGTYIIGAVAALLIGVGGYKWWDGRQAAAAEAAGLRFEQALNLAETGNADEALKSFSAIAGGTRSNYGVLAQLAVAGQAVKAGKTDDAIAAYEAAAGRASDTLIKDYARLQSTSLKIDAIDYAEAKNRLNELIGDKNPWRYMARELLGVAAVRAGQMDEASTTLAPLSADPRAPAAVRERAGALMNMVVAAQLEKNAPSKIEFEKADPPAAKPEADPAKAEPARGKAVPKGGAVKGK